MQRTSAILIGVLVATVLSGACESETSPSEASIFSGTWVGAITTNLSGIAPGTATVTLTQAGATVTGSWTTVYPDPSNNGGGSVSATANGNALSGTLTPSNPSSCPYTVNATVSGNQMTGTYAAFNCTLSFGGTLTLTRQ